jgi:hypothetical protein
LGVAKVDVLDVLNAIFYLLSTGRQCAVVPKDLSPKSTAHNYFGSWDWDGMLDRMDGFLGSRHSRAAGRSLSTL